MMHEDKPAGYYDCVQEDLLALIPTGRHKVLDIGAGAGVLGEALKKTGKAEEVVGVELNPGSAEKAKDKLDKVICGDIEDVALPFPEGYFDYVIFGDVLEHLKDPWAALEKVKKCLADDGKVVASIPNVRHWRVLKDLAISGKWEYTADGVLDKTHLRFFTRSGIKDLFTASGFKINRISGLRLKKGQFVNTLTLGLLEDILNFKYLVTASRKEGRCLP